MPSRRGYRIQRDGSKSKTIDRSALEADRCQVMVQTPSGPIFNDGQYSTFESVLCRRAASQRRADGLIVCDEHAGQAEIEDDEPPELADRWVDPGEL